MTEWQPIETARKNGTKILLWKDGWDYAPVAYWGSHINNAFGNEFGGWYFADCNLSLGHDCGFLGWNEDIEGGYMPTHWAPMPTKGIEL
jgi:hypothetical protein